MTAQTFVNNILATPIECSICETPIETTEQAIDEGWMPDFYTKDDKPGGPVCPECAESFLEVAGDGTMELVVDPKDLGLPADEFM